jgi:hypothetical protein
MDGKRTHCGVYNVEFTEGLRERNNEPIYLPSPQPVFPICAFQAKGDRSWSGKKENIFFKSYDII